MLCAGPFSVLSATPNQRVSRFLFYQKIKLRANPEGRKPFFGNHLGRASVRDLKDEFGVIGEQLHFMALGIARLFHAFSGVQVRRNQAQTLFLEKSLAKNSVVLKRKFFVLLFFKKVGAACLQQAGWGRARRACLLQAGKSSFAVLKYTL